MVVSSENRVVCGVSYWVERGQELAERIGRSLAGDGAAAYSQGRRAGAGRISLALTAQGFDVAGVDISEGLLKHARRNAQRRALSVEFLLVDSLSLPFDPGRFDIVLLFKVYCCIPTRVARPQCLDEAARVLSPDGVILVSQYVAPDENFEEYPDEDFEKIAPKFTRLQPGDTFPDGCGYVRWFTERQCIDKIQDFPFVLESY